MSLTIKDVAEKAGVSVTTVSRVLNDRGYISAKTRKKVMTTMEELNYTPNEMARSFLSNKTRFIALIVPTTENPFFGELTFHIEKELAQKGYNLFICNSLNDVDNEKKYLRLLQEKRVDGVIVGSHNININEYEYFENKIVSIERELTAHIPIIQSDNYLGGKLAAQELVDKGCKRILCIRGDQHIKTPANDRATAYKDVMEENGLNYSFKEVPFQLQDQEKEALIDQIFAGEVVYDGIFAGDDIIAKMCINSAIAHGKSVPEELKVIGFDGTKIVRQLNPELSTIIQPIEKLAQKSVKILLAVLNEEKVNQVTKLSVKLLASNSTKR
ncbi:MAG: LacI family DNA-binding transcriptional regulator [Tetragenococcus koreensis]|nr:LacI family DNA-binding transcriptional regulator [Tetragenococcus koreensis]MDN6598337.1 LacI family DNA-binding transcriptional regulator [Tetragenococcus koreensis]MDN6700473.1 LacI family DNA-binding transcriptional regulator [Tetragenococcus koreensis]